MDIQNKQSLLFLTCASKNKLCYLCIEEYAVSRYGFHCHTKDLDIWIAPTNQNKICSLTRLSYDFLRQAKLWRGRDKDCFDFVRKNYKQGQT